MNESLVRFVVKLSRILAIVLLATAPAAEAFSEDRPNIVLIMVDDMGRDWVSCYGSSHPTPHIDRLAEEGVRFETAWSSPICTPTRVQLLTGLYPFQTGWTDHHDAPRWGGRGFDPQQFSTFAQLARNAGYATAIGGKWQINDLRTHPEALAEAGFDEHCVWTGYETGNAPPSDKRYWDGYLMTNGEREVHAYGPDAVNAFLIDFVERRRDGPFLVYYPMMLVHGPFLPTPLNAGDPPEGRDDLYAGMVTYMDLLVGRLVRRIDELGLREKTVILFTCDNGSSVGGTLHGEPHPKGKGQITDWGMHVPFIVRAPMLTGGGRVCADLTDFTDLLPTVAELCDAPLANPEAHYGRSLVPSIRGESSEESVREFIFTQRGERRTVRDRRWKLDHTGAFWDLAADPLQQHDLRNSEAPTVAAARARLRSVLESLPDDAGPPFAGYRAGIR